MVLLGDVSPVFVEVGLVLVLVSCGGCVVASEDPDVVVASDDPGVVVESEDPGVVVGGVSEPDGVEMIGLNVGPGHHPGR